MNQITIYNHLTDDELLRHIDLARHHSPIIEELAKRLESSQTGDDSGTKKCPVCEAQVRVGYDDGFYLELP